ncbi:hypothetical protein BG004_002203 [Podila humilis]|nr:hypothetical protein BG004_002203 [Podila humilis]
MTSPVSSSTPTTFSTIKRPVAEDSRPSFSIMPSSPALHTSRADSHADYNIERNHRTLPLPMTSSTYPSIPRFAPVPQRMSGNYTLGSNHPSNNGITTTTSSTSSSNNNIFGRTRSGTNSASSSPPGTPPSGLRSHYLNAAFHRSQHQFYAMGTSAPGSTTSFHPQHSPQRPNISILVPHPSSSVPRIEIPEPVVHVAQRQEVPLHQQRHQQRPASAVDYLRIDEPEITITSPGGSNSTEHHATTLQRALSILAEKESHLEEADELNDNDGDGDESMTDGHITIMKRSAKTSSASTSSSSTPPGTPPHKKKGVTKFPKMVVDRLDPKTAALADAASTTTTSLQDHRRSSNLVQNRHSSTGSSDTTLTDLNNNTEPTVKKMMRQDGQPTTITIGATPVPVRPDTSDLSRQLSKAGVLSNLLILQRLGRQAKSSTKPRKEKKVKVKVKRPTMYSRSANNSNASLNTKSIFNTYPALPATTPTKSSFAPGTMTNFQHPNNTASGKTRKNSASIGNINNTPSNNNSNRNSIQFDNYFAGAFFSAATSPMYSPTLSPRGSFSGGELTPNGVNSGSGTPNGGSYFPGSGPMKGSGGSGNGGGGLSTEEQLRITLAVADILERQDYILRLAKSLIKYGAPSHRLEDAIDHSARHLEINLQCVYLPNVMIVAFTDFETHTSETHLLKCAADLDMYKCALVHQVHKMVTHESMPVEEAIMKLEAINSERDANPRWATILAYAMAGFCTAPMFFNGSWVDAGVSFLVGGAVGLMVWLAEKVPSYSHICEITMSVVVAFVAEALNGHMNYCASAIKLAGVVIILPGYTITCAILELSSRHIISGSVRLFYAIAFSLLLGYGLTIGASLWHLFDPVSDETSQTVAASVACTSSLDPKWNILFVPLFAISLNIWLRAHPRQWPLATILSIVGYTVSYTTSVYGGAKTEVSSALAAFAIGFCGNIYQRLTRQLSFQAVVCAVFFLVPGSIGLKGAMAWFSDDVSAGLNFALQMVVTAIAISVGLFASALVVYPMGKARSAQMTF